MDILNVLDSALDKTPEHVLICPPLSRCSVAAAAAEIRSLRARLAAGASPGKTQPAAVIVARYAGADEPGGKDLL